MVKACSAVFIFLTLAACTGVPQFQHIASPCAAGEASWECQIERYHNVNVQ